MLDESSPSRGRRPPLTLRPYQKEAVDAVLAHFRRSSETACVVLPTGAGKSIVIAQLALLARGRVLVLAHVAELCEQNYEKFLQLGGAAGLYAAGLGHKNSEQPVTFGTVQSVAANLREFASNYSLIVIDECHRVSGETETQYGAILAALRDANPQLKVLGLTATPYRLGLGWIYRYHHRNIVRSSDPLPFEMCVFELSLTDMLRAGYLTRPRVVDAPIAQYDFSTIASDPSGRLPAAAVNELLVRHTRVTQAIVEQVVELAEDRQGVMLFAATVEHAREIAGYLPEGTWALIVGETAQQERERNIRAFKDRKLKFLVNVAVLTTGFDAPHVDLIAVLRPTASVSLFQQIAGRGLRLAPGKEDCLIVDYAGNGFNLFSPEVGAPRPSPDSVPVTVECPACGCVNTFWGRLDLDGDLIEHYGRRCAALLVDNGRRSQCDFRFKFKECPYCATPCDIAARTCPSCKKALSDPDEILKAALGLKDALVLRVAGITLKAKGEVLTVAYHDEDGVELTERFDLSQAGQRGVFFRVFGPRTHNGVPLNRQATATELVQLQNRMRPPDFVVARKNRRFWNVQERVFDYKGRRRKAGEK